LGSAKVSVSAGARPGWVFEAIAVGQAQDGFGVVLVHRSSSTDRLVHSV
jgi:hypothetical protein